jgi:hypothetical protein
MDTISESSSSDESIISNSELENIDQKVISDEDESQGIPEESKISKTLSDSTTKWVVMLVLSLLFLLAVCSVDSYFDVKVIHE